MSVNPNSVHWPGLVGTGCRLVCMWILRTARVHQVRLSWIVAALSLLIVVLVGRGLVLQHLRLANNYDNDYDHDYYSIRKAAAAASSSSTAAANPKNDGGGSLMRKKNQDEEEEEEQVCNLLWDDACLQRIAYSMRRVWPIKPVALWCNSSTSFNDDDDDDDNSNNKHNIGRTGRGRGCGMMLTKVPKSASSTAAAVVLRLQQRLQCTNMAQWQHGRAADLYATVNHRSHNNHSSICESLLLAPLRAPDTRALSSVYFHTISFHGHHRQNKMRQQQSNNNNNNNSIADPDVVPADKFILQKLAETPSNYITDYLSLVPPPVAALTVNHWNISLDEEAHNVDAHDVATTARRIQQTVQQILDAYDFLLVAERLDESLVVLAHVLGLDDRLADFVTLSSKVAAGGGRPSIRTTNNNDHNDHNDHDRPPTTTTTTNWYASHGRCLPLVAPVRTTAVHAYFESIAWKQKHAADRLLHAAAVASLQATLDHLQQQQQQRAAKPLEWQLEQFRRMKRHAVTECRTSAQFPCSANGTLQLDVAATNCYWRDLGCGYPCLDRVLLQQQQQQSVEPP